MSGHDRRNAQNGFYEWQQLSDQQGGSKQPFYIHPVGGEFFALAGLWERWTRPADGEVLDAFTIVTTEAVNCHHNYVAREHHFGADVWVAHSDDRDRSYRRT